METDSGSSDLERRSEELLAYGGRHRVLLRPLYEDERGAFPHFAAEAHGYELTDADGRRFVDWTSTGGPMLLGYRHPEVEAAITAQLERRPDAVRCRTRSSWRSPSCWSRWSRAPRWWRSARTAPMS